MPPDPGHFITGASAHFEQAIIFSQSFGLGDGTYLDKIATPADCKVCEPIVFGLSTAVCSRRAGQIRRQFRASRHYLEKEVQVPLRQRLVRANYIA
jgi:hypothetical protein